MIAKTLPLALLAVAFFSVDFAAPDASQDAQAPAKVAKRSTETFQVDAGHSAVLFRVRHLQAGPFWGRFNKVSGEFKVDDAKLEDSFVKIEIPVDSIDSNSANRDRHLKSQDFFAAKEYPTIKFASTKVSKKGDGYELEGTLELRGKKKKVSASVEHVGTANLSKRFGLRCGYEARFVIKRSDFGMTYMTKGDMLGDDVTVIVAIEGMLPRKR